MGTVTVLQASLTSGTLHDSNFGYVLVVSTSAYDIIGQSTSSTVKWEWSWSISSSPKIVKGNLYAFIKSGLSVIVL